MVVLWKLLIVTAVVALLHSSENFRKMSREFDEAAVVSLKRMIRATEESGYPSETVPFLIVFTTLVFMGMLAAGEIFSR